MQVAMGPLNFENEVTGNTVQGLGLLRASLACKKEQAQGTPELGGNLLFAFSGF